MNDDKIFQKNRRKDGKMKKKILALFTAAALMAVGVPAGVMAEGTSADKVTVNFSAGVPGAFDMVDEELTVQGDLADKYFPDVAINEPEGVTIADALVAAHIKKYGKEKVKDYMDISNGDWGTQMNKQFGNSNVGLYFINNTSENVMSVSTKIKDGDKLFAGAFKEKNAYFTYSFFKKEEYKAVAGKKFTVKLAAEGSKYDEKTYTSSYYEVIPGTATVVTVDKKTGKMTETQFKSNSNGQAIIKLNKAGELYISAIGTADGGFGDNPIAGAIAKITVGLDKAKITKAKAKGKRAVLKWKKVIGAKKYEVYKGTKKKGKFKKIATVKKTTYTDKKIKKSNKNKNYFYKVRAIAKADGKTVKGKFSKTARIKIKKAR